MITTHATSKNTYKTNLGLVLVFWLLIFNLSQNCKSLLHLMHPSVFSPMFYNIYVCVKNLIK